MSKTSPINEIIQQLDTLSLEQLLEVREKVDALIKGKAYESASSEINDFKHRSLAEYYAAMSLLSPPSIDKLTLLAEEYKRTIQTPAIAGMEKSKLADWLLRSKSFERRCILFLDAIDIPPEDVDAEDETLEDAIKLVEEWMSDESGYDEETYPQIEAALNQNRLSL